MASMMFVRIALDRAVEAGAEQRVDDQRGFADRHRIAGQHRTLPAARGERRIALQGVAFAEQDDGDAAAARYELGRRDKSIAAIVAASGDDQDRPLLDEVHGRLRHRLAGAQHQREARRAAGDRQPVGVLHFGGRENFHAQFSPKAPHPEAFFTSTRAAHRGDCMQIGLFAYFVSFAIFGLRLWSTPKAL